MKRVLLLVRGMLILSILIGLILPFILGCNQTNTSPVDSKEIRNILFHINDVHSQIDNFAMIAWVVKQEKKKNPRAADRYAGIPSTYPVHLPGFTFSDLIATAKKYRYLKKENEIFIALTHTIKFSHQYLGKSLMVTVNDAIIQFLKQEKDAYKGIEKPRMLMISIDDGNRSEKSKESLKR